jgi:acetylornithine deacetylase/succinyl-diaminopimelate desuccinylase-like protein
VADNKGCLLSRIQAVEAFRDTIGVLPVDVKFLIEGEEEIGSPNLHQFVSSHRDMLKADACIWEYAAKDSEGRPSATLGNKGMCYVEFLCRGSKIDFHSMYAGLIPNPAWRLVWALATLKDANENVVINGFYEKVQPLSPQEQEVLEEMPIDEAGFKQGAGLSELLNDVQGMEAKLRLYGQPTCTVCGLISGHTGSGARTIIPALAIAKVDFRLVVGQTPQDILRKLRVHLDNCGFSDIEVNPLSTALPAKTSVTDPFVKIVAESAHGVYSEPLVIHPTSPGTGPRWMFSEWTDMPIVGLGVGHAGSQIHAPNENIFLQDYREGIKHIAAILGRF